jgi:hypothetical protein
MQDTRQCFPTAVSFPEAAAKFKVISAFESSMIVPSVANQEHRDRDALGRYKAQQQRSAVGAREVDTGEIREACPRPGRLLTPPFGLFLRAALLAHLERTFR